MLELLIVIFLGLVFGSFVTCASYRLPLDQDIIRKPSFCPKCNHKLTFLDLWPVLSWLLSRGACRHCKTKISVRYPLTELATGAGFALCYVQYGMSIQTLVLCLAVVALMVMIVVDLEHYIIPDSVHVVLLPLGIAFHAASVNPDWMDVLFGFLVLGGLALILHYGYSALRGRVMLGFGDVKFFAVAGVWLGLFLSAPFLFVSGILGVVLGLIWRKLGKGEVFPFGPALAASLLLCVLYKQNINQLINQYILYN